MSEDEELFDEEFLRRLRKMFYKLRQRRRLEDKGKQHTPSTGFTQEFKEHRSYSPGDDFRSIDWRLYARLGKLFIRIYEDVEEFHLHILIDRSGSMMKPHGRKRVVALRLAVGLAYLGLINDHRVSLFSFRDDMTREMPPLNGQGHIHDILDRMRSLEFGGTTRLGSCLNAFRPHQDRRGMIFVLSDLFGRGPEASLEAVRQHLSWRAETHVVHVLHPEELEPDLEGEVRLRDVETGEVRQMNLSKRDLQRYRDRFEQFVERLRQECLKREIDYFTWNTSEPFENAFISLLARGSSLTQR